MKFLLKKVLPPIFMDLFRLTRKSSSNQFSGDYNSWSAAESACSGYDTEKILSAVKSASLKVKSGESSFERDSVNFDKIQYSWPVLSGLFLASAQKGELNVIDFGGALGSSFQQNKQFLKNAGIRKLTWNIVEQEKFVECGRAEFATDELKFYFSLDECLKNNSAEVILLSSVLPYISNPFEILKTIISLKIKFIIVDRTAIFNSKTRITKQQVPVSIYEASYPAWFFNEEELLNLFCENYELLSDFDALGGEVLLTKPSAKAFYKGYIFKAKK